MKTLVARTTLFSACMAAALVTSACGTDNPSAETHGQAVQPMLGVVGIESANGMSEVVMVPMRSRQMTADWALEFGVRLSLSDVEAYVATLPPNTLILPMSADAFTDYEGRLKTLDGDTADRFVPAFAKSSSALTVSTSTAWGAGRSSRGNCYRYAVNDPTKPGEPHSPFPGGTDPGGHISCDDIMDGARCEGAVDPKADGSCPAGYSDDKICGAIQDKTAPGHNDYHWWKETGAGWTSKPGFGAVQADGDPSDPANRGSYDLFCGCLCVPLGPVVIDADSKCVRQVEGPVEVEHVQVVR